MNRGVLSILFALFLLGVVLSELPIPATAQPQPPATDTQLPPVKKPVSLESLDVKLDDAEKRLYSIEDKIDHLLYHHTHDVTPHNIEFSPMGPVMIPDIKNPKSAHTQMKTHDILRGGMINPYSYGYPMMGMGMGMGYEMGYGGYPPLY